MKFYGVPRVNGLGKKGPEDFPELFSEKFVKLDRILDLKNEDVGEDEKKIYEFARGVFGEGKVVFVGGDHSVTFPLFKAFRENFKDAFLIVFDAHADCMEPMKEPTHEEFLRAIIELGFEPARVILVGARKIEPEERNFLEEKGVKVFGADIDLEAAADYITEQANGRDVYVSIDIDVLDPAFAPAVNYPEPSGFSSRELFYLLGRVFRIKSLKALDLVEVVPEKDKRFDFRTTAIAKKVVELFARI